MSFWSILLHYAVCAVPLAAAYLVALRYSLAAPKTTSMLFVAGNLAAVGYVVHLGTTAGDLSLVRSLAYAIGAMFIVLVPSIVAIVAVTERRDRNDRSAPE